MWTSAALREEETVEEREMANYLAIGCRATLMAV